MTNYESSIFTLPDLPAVGLYDFERLARMLRDRAGIVLGSHKQEMASRTLGVRANKMGMTEVKDYLDHLQQNPSSPEWAGFINAFTINHTAFFREQHHFSMLADFVRKRPKPLSIWCCASSTGEEPYSIAMTLHEACVQPDVGVSILASDIDTTALERASLGVYSLERIEPVPEEHLRKYFQRGTGRRAGLARVKSNIRDMVEFAAINLVSPNWPLSQKFDAIFCRNTMIYFDKATQTRLLERFAGHLKPDGLLFAGHSENFTYLTKTFRLRGQTVYELA